MIKEFAVAVTKQPRTTQTRDAKPTRLIPYLFTKNPAGRLRKIPGRRTMDMTNPTSVLVILNASMIESNKGGAS
jgi:hypothetical protein